MCMAGINDATGVREKLSYSTLDSLFDALQDMARCTKVEIAGALQHIHSSSVNTSTCRSLWRYLKQTSTLHIGAYQCGQVGNYVCSYCYFFVSAAVLLSGDRQFASIMFLHDDIAYGATHLGMPFGAVASVHAWHRIGM